MTPPPFPSLSARYADLERSRLEKKTSPYVSDAFAVPAVAATAVIMAYGGLFGAISILLFYALWLPRLRRKGTFLLRPSSPGVALTLLLPALAVASALWSRAPGVTLYCALEYASLIVCTVIMAKITRLEAFMRGMILGCAAVLAASLASGVYGQDPFTGAYALFGLFGSKNMVGLFAEIGIFLLLIGLLARRRLLTKLAFDLPLLALFVLSLYLSRSASSVLSLAITLAVIAAVYAITRLPRPYRVFAATSVALFFITAAAAALTLGWEDAVFKTFGKDKTLTGRTHLWDEGLKAGMERPWIGHGYSAFWVHGQPKAEQLWQEFNIPTRDGFHFHNLFIELFVELGAAGVAVMALVMLICCIKSLHLALRHGMSPGHVFALGMAVMFLSRAFVEVDTIGTFTIGPVLFFSLPLRMAQARKEAALNNASSAASVRL